MMTEGETLASLYVRVQGWLTMMSHEQAS